MYKHLKDNFDFLTIFFLGFSSGLPFYLLVSTLSAWLVQSNISKTDIGIFFWVTITYSLKFLWSPLLETIKIPLIGNKMGRRKSWMFSSQIVLICLLIVLSKCNPKENLSIFMMFSFFIGFFSSIQDISIEAYRIEILSQEKVGMGASLSVLGYRLGMMFSGAGSLYVAEFFGWEQAIQFVSFFVFVGLITTLSSREPSINFIEKKYSYKRLISQPLNSFIKNNNWMIILPFIMFFKFGDSILNAMSIPFLLEIGFSKMEIASVGKTFGISAMVLGTLLSGILLSKKSLRLCLILSIFLQILACMLFVVQANIGNSIIFLFITIGIENIASGISQVALITYLSRLCQNPYAGAQYALVSSYSSFSRVVLSFLAGFMADLLSWESFYILITAFCVPALLILIFAKRHFFY